MAKGKISDAEAAEALAAIQAADGNITAAARALGCSWTAVQRRLARAHERGLDGIARPQPLPPGRRIGKVTEHWDRRTGELVQSWTRTESEAIDPAALADIWREALDGLKALPEAPAPARTGGGLLTVYPVVDHHHGLYSYVPETGASYDVERSAEVLRRAQAALLERTPSSAEALLVVMGDFFHANDSRGVTPAHNHRLDVDTRPDKVALTGAEMLVEAVERLLRRHTAVSVRVLKGNHDPDSSLGVALALHYAFRRNPRVTVDLSPALWAFRRHGVNLLGFTHGHTIKPEDMVPAMSAAVPGLWGRTRRRVVFHAHFHRRQVIPSRGGVAEGLAPSTAADAYAAGLGFFTGRAMTAITLCARTGRESRETECLDLLDLETPPKCASLS